MKLLVGNVGPGVMVSLTRAVIGLGGRGEIKQGLNGLHNGPINFDVRSPGGGGGVLPYMGYIGMCRCEGYGFQAVYSRIGYINKSVWL